MKGVGWAWGGRSVVCALLQSWILGQRGVKWVSWQPEWNWDGQTFMVLVVCSHSLSPTTFDLLIVVSPLPHLWRVTIVVYVIGNSFYPHTRLRQYILQKASMVFILRMIPEFGSPFFEINQNHLKNFSWIWKQHQLHSILTNSSQVYTIVYDDIWIWKLKLVWNILYQFARGWWLLVEAKWLHGPTWSR